MDNIDIFTKIVNLKLNIKRILTNLEFSKLNEVSYIKDIENEKRFVVAFDEEYFEMWIYDKKTDKSYKDTVYYETMLKDMIFYDLTEEIIIDTILEELRIYG